MIPSYRNVFNHNFTHKKYENFLEELTKGLPSISFRIAETPVFLDKTLVEKLTQAGEEIINFIRRPDFKTITKDAIPKQWNVPNENDHPHFLTFDYAICKDESGVLIPKLIELQGFPSLYGFQPHLAKMYRENFDLGQLGKFSPYFGDYNTACYESLLRQVILGKHQPDEVALMDLDAPHQQTFIDFYITKQLTGIKILSITDIFKEGRQLFYEEKGIKKRLKRIYNRLIFDEVENPDALFATCFDPREDLDVEWATHPNWFYRISKFTMPFLKYDFVPKTQFLNEVVDFPADLENYVLKPLFSFAGQGVIVDIDITDLEKISDPENWILQHKVTYEPVVKALDGCVKTEIRMMYLWADGEEPKLCMNLARLSRGKMIGVRYNKDFDWVGGTVALMPK